MTPYGDTDLGQHWFGILMACCLMESGHYLNQYCLIIRGSSCIPLKTMSYESRKISISKISLTISVTLSKFSHFPGPKHKILAPGRCARNYLKKKNHNNFTLNIQNIIWDACSETALMWMSQNLIGSINGMVQAPSHYLSRWDSVTFTSEQFHSMHLS